MFPHPLTLRANAKGLCIGYSDKPTVTPREYMFPYEKDLLVGIDGLSAPGITNEQSPLRTGIAYERTKVAA